MNKEQRKFNKIIKKRKCRVKVMKEVRQFMRTRQIEFTERKDANKKAMKERSESILQNNFARFDYLRNVLNIPTNEIYSLHALEKMYEIAQKREEIRKKEGETKRKDIN